MPVRVEDARFVLAPAVVTPLAALIFSIGDGVARLVLQTIFGLGAGILLAAVLALGRAAVNDARRERSERDFEPDAADTATSRGGEDDVLAAARRPRTASPRGEAA